MKRNLISIILICFLLSTYAENFDVLNGGWMNQSWYENVTKNQWSFDFRRDSSAWGGKRIKYSGIEISIESDGTGSYSDSRDFRIERVEKQGDNKFLLYLLVSVSVAWGDYKEGDIIPAGEILITVIDEDTIFVTYGEEISRKGTQYEAPWYRVSGPAKIPLQYGLMNDDRVRLRTKPNLECDVWGFLSKGTWVTIIDKSAEKQKIDDMEDYWYKVRTDSFSDGWVYGAFIDIKDVSPRLINPF